MADATWRCPSCDTYNEANASACMVCDERNAVAGPTWRCQQCDTWNEATRPSCQVCETARTSAPGAGTEKAATEIRRLPGNAYRPPALPEPAPPTPAPPPPEPARTPAEEMDDGAWPAADEPKTIFLPPRTGAPPLGAPVRPRGSRGVVVVVVAIVVVVLIMLALAAGEHESHGAAPTRTSSARPPDSPSPGTPDTGSGQEQARSVDALLTRAASTRSSLSQVVEGVLDCSDVDGGVSSLSGVVTDRESQLNDARNLDVDAIAGGEDMKNALIEALSSSLDADRAFLSWARNAQDGGCDGTAPITDDYRTGESDSVSAGQGKSRFVALWNAVAPSYGLNTRSDDDI